MAANACSWFAICGGRNLGLLAVRERPDAYSAYVGMGQIAGTKPEIEREQREFLTVQASATRDKALLTRLEAGRRPTEDDLFRYGAELYMSRSSWSLLLTGLRAPEYTLRDVLNAKTGAVMVGRMMQYDVDPKLFEGEVLEIRV